MRRKCKGELRTDCCIEMKVKEVEIHFEISSKPFCSIRS